MPDFSHRSYMKELLDNEGIPFMDIKKNMQELETINKYLGGHRATINGVKQLLPASISKLTICEIGCGGGDNLAAIQRWISPKKIKTNYIGIDINKECIAYAKENCDSLNAQWIISDFIDVKLNPKPDIIFSSLFCHHFTDEQVAEQLLWMKENTKIGFFINDLHRHPFAYYTIKMLTKIFSGSYLVKNDAPLSVLRGFTKKELSSIFRQVLSANEKISWLWAFRWLLIVRNEK